MTTAPMILVPADVAKGDPIECPWCGLSVYAVRSEDGVTIALVDPKSVDWLDSTGRLYCCTAGGIVAGPDR